MNITEENMPANNNPLYPEKKYGLVLEGGAMRGLFSAGILDCFLEEKIALQGIAGVSAGAAFSCNYKSGQAGRVLRYNKRFCRDPRYCSVRSWWKTGDLFGAEFCYHTLPETLDPFDAEAYNRNPVEFFLVCTDVHTGKAHYQACPVAGAECYEWMRASSSMPLVSRIVSVGGGEYLDGAIADSIPLRFMERMGYEKNIVILTQPAGYRKKPSHAMMLLLLALRKYPALVKAMENRHRVYNETLAYVEKQASEGKVLLLRPEEPLPIRRICHDPDKLQFVYDTGKALAYKHLEEIRSFLNTPPRCF
jgi:predicted patatin/cPLA2 family phospholipase